LSCLELSVLRSERAGELVNLLRLTPFARQEFKAAYEISPDPVEEARRLVIRSFMGFGSDGFNRDVTTGFRAYSERSPAHDWANFPEALRVTVERLQDVVIEHRPALDVITAADAEYTLFYLDPPYLHGTRSQKYRKGNSYHAYRHEMTDADHKRLLRVIRKVKGMVVLSGYPSALYDEALSKWERIERSALADGARKRTEVLWLSPRTTRALNQGLLLEATA